MSSIVPTFIWEAQFGVESPYLFDIEVFDPALFESGSLWDDISSDVRTDPPPTFSRGMRGGTPEDRVADVGVLSFVLNNFPWKAPRKLGYYTPGHANQREGFGLGHGFRLRVVYRNLSKVLFFGTFESITPQPGQWLSRHVDVTVTDWMEEAATSQVEGLSTLLDVNSSQVFAELVDAMPRRPTLVLLDEGLDTYAYALDTVREEGGSVLNEFQKLAMSELAYIFVTAEGFLKFQNRAKRAVSGAANAYTFERELDGLSVRRSRADMFNKVRVTVHPRRRDPADVVLYSLSQPTLIKAGTVVEMRVSYSDPDQRGRRIGAVNVQPMIRDTDYVGNTAEDGTGTYASFYLGVDVTSDGNGAKVLVSNVAPADIWLTKLQIRGQGLYDLEPIVSSAEDTDSVEQFGRRSRSFDMPYQSNALIGASAASYWLNIYAQDSSLVDSVSFIANTSDATMRQALTLDIGSRIGIRESVTAVTDVIAGSVATKGWFINGVRGEIQMGKYLRMTYLLSPSDASTYWQLGVPGAGEIGITTRLGYGLFRQAA